MRDRFTTSFLIALLAVMTFIPLLHSGYTTQDDVYFAVGIGKEGWRSPWLFDAVNSGRLQHVVDGQLTPIGFGWGNYWVGKGVAIVTILSNVVALFVLLRLITGDSRIGLLAVVCFFAFVQNTWDHNLLTAYPFILSFMFTLLLVALAQWYLALERAEPSTSPPSNAWSVRRLRTWSLVLFAVSLFSYESFMVYGFLFPALTFAVARGSWPERLRRALRTPHLPVLAVFVVAVVLFRVLLMSDTGQANSAAQEYAIKLSPYGVWRVLERYSTSALPMHYFRVYRDLINDFYLGYGSFRTRFFDIFRVFDVAWLIKAAIVAFLVGSITASRTLVRRRGLLFVFVLVFMVLTNLPLAVTSKYQAWVIQSYSHAYLTAYFVFFGVVILLAVVLDSLVGGAARAGGRWSKVAAWALGVVTFLVSYGTDFQNAHVAASQRQMFDRSAAVDAWVASPIFRSMPPGSVVFAPSLWDIYPGTTFVYEDYWTRYVTPSSKPLAYPWTLSDVCANRYPAPCIIQVLTDETRKLVQDAEANGRLYYLKLVRDPRNDLSYIAAGRLGTFNEGEPFGSAEVTLITHARAEHLRVVGYLHDVADGCRARVFVDGTPSSGTFDSMFGVHLDRRRAPEAWPVTKLTTSSGLIDPETINVYQSAETLDGAVEVRYGEGFYPDEVAHRWAQDKARLTLVNRTDRPMQVDLQFEIRAPWAPAGSSHRLQVAAGDAKVDWPIGEKLAKRTIPVALPPRTAVDIVFSTDAPRIDPTRDGRNLVLMFLPTVKAKERGCEP